MTQSSGDLKICVVGAGVIGLSTALRLCQEIQNVKVTILADKFLSDTTSDGAAGLWEPYKLGSTPEHLVNSWAEETFLHFRRIYDSSECGPAGISQVPCASLYSKEGYAPPSWRHIPGDFRRMTRAELQRHSTVSGKQYVAGHTFTTLFCEGSLYLPWLTRQLLSCGMLMQGRQLSSLTDLHGEGGHVIRVRAPWIQSAYFEDDEFYVLPNHDTVVLGGTGHIGDSNLEPRQKDRDHIWQGVLRLLPSLAKATVEREWEMLCEQ
ncbi:hypothetical protein WJX73_007439 [Symbiochloris irregularis]|uniref:FAD dependent oxidoreductase domain-containing protein n=1 Tax=Symbiochloris irregularis TaxID=706552 RepID=A0AAW1PD34_9CHLO